MENTNRFSLMIDALTELAEEEQAHQAMPAPPAPGLPALSTVIADASPLPREALFLGLAEDSLPVLLNLFDPIPGPILITGDQASGKTILLQTIAQATDLLHSPSEVQYGVITQYPDEWANIQNNQNNAGIYASQDNNSKELMQSLVTWAHNNKGDSQSVLLMIDDLEAVTKLDEQTQQNLRWLLLRGPSRRVWPMVTLNVSRAASMEAWLGFFRTRLFGRIKDIQEANLITGNSNHALHDLTAGSQFSMREGKNWLNFWTPVID